MAKADIWMPFYVADYLADTMHLSAAEHGGYLMLILHYWRTGPIPNDPERLANISRLGNAWEKSSPTILQFFSIEDGMLIHKRIDIERLLASSNKEKKAVSGSIGAKAKWGSVVDGKLNRSERLANARQLATHSLGEWHALRESIGCCVKCGSVNDLVKDHIKPIYQGGSDGIENIQPLCRSCNASKGPEAIDYRPNDWRELMAKRLANACQTPSPSPSPSPSLKQKAKAEASATRLPADWSMSAEDCEFCSTTRPDLNALETASRFRDYWIAQPGTKGRKVDWPATWRNWVRNEKQQARASPGYKNIHDQRAETIAILTGRKSNERTNEHDITGESFRVA